MEAEERNKDVDGDSLEKENEYMQETIVDLKQSVRQPLQEPEEAC